MARGIKKTRIYSALEVANVCGVVNQTAINWIRKGHLKAFTTPGGQYRVYAADFVAFLESHGMQVPEELEEQLHKDQQRSNTEDVYTPSSLRLLYITTDQRQVDMLLQYVSNKKLRYQITAVSSLREAFSFIADKLPSVILYDPDGIPADAQTLLDSYILQLKQADPLIPECIIEPFKAESEDTSNAYTKLNTILVA